MNDDDIENLSAFADSVDAHTDRSGPGGGRSAESTAVAFCRRLRASSGC